MGILVGRGWEKYGVGEERQLERLGVVAFGGNMVNTAPMRQSLILSH